MEPSRHQVKLGEKGQMILSKAIRDYYHLSKGHPVRIIDLGNGIIKVILLKHSSERQQVRENASKPQ